MECQYPDESENCKSCQKKYNEKLKFDKTCEQTTKKVELVSKYSDLWSEKINVPNIDEIRFIDCMCNASKYEDGSLTTSARVIQILTIKAKKAPKKIFKVFLNDVSKNRILDLLSFVESLDIPPNLKIYYYCVDVNCFLNHYLSIKKKTNNNSLTLLYVDPYNFGLVDNSYIIRFLNETYSELIYNYMIMDPVRNLTNKKAHKKSKELENEIINTFGQETYADILSNIDNLEKAISDTFNLTKYSKSTIGFDFRNSTNGLIYKILFFAHRYEGFKLYRDALWEVFEGEDFHRNKKGKTDFARFDDAFYTQLKENVITKKAEETQIFIKDKFRNEFVLNEEFKKTILLEINIRDKHILKYVISPLIKKGELVKVSNIESKSKLGERYKWNDE